MSESKLPAPLPPSSNGGGEIDDTTKPQPPSSSTVASSSIPLPDDADRFALELEFVECLASPAYLHYLATSGLLSESAFLDFLRYLRSYWTTPEYARFLSYPHCLRFLDLLIDNPLFRREMATVPFRDFVHEQQFYAWQHRASRLFGKGLDKTGPGGDGAEAEGGGGESAVPSLDPAVPQADVPGSTAAAAAGGSAVSSLPSS